MTEDEMIALVRGDLEEDLAAPTEDEIRELLALPRHVTRAEVDRVRQLFLRYAVEAEQPNPVRGFGPGVSFGSWLKSVRERIPATRGMVAAAIESGPYLIERIESDEAPLWEFDHHDVAALMDIFGIHVRAVEAALRNVRPPSARAERDRPADRRGVGQGRGASQNMTALEPFGTRRSTGPAEWLEALRHALKERGADRLLN